MLIQGGFDHVITEKNKTGPHATLMNTITIRFCTSCEYNESKVLTYFRQMFHI